MNEKDVLQWFDADCWRFSAGRHRDEVTEFVLRLAGLSEIEWMGVMSNEQFNSTVNL